MAPGRGQPNLTWERESFFPSAFRHEHGQQGVVRFLRSATTLPLTLLAGLACIIAATAFTTRLSKEIFQCPDWSIQCTVDSNIVWIQAHLGTVQGIVTAFYVASLAAIAHVAHAFAETMVWPLLSKQSYSLKQLDTYLSASQGSIPSILFAFGAAKDLETVLIILGLCILAAVPLSAAPLVGYVYELQNITMPFEASYLPAGGMGPVFTQRSTAPVMPKSVSQTVSKYIAWSNQLSLEPLPDYRSWIERNITCSGHTLNLTHPESEIFLTVDTLLRQRYANRKKKSDEIVRIRDQPRSTLWVHDFEFVSPHRTRSTLVFAALNGKIETGLPTSAPPTWKEDWPSGISAVSCTVDVELVDDTLMVGSGFPAPPETINSLDIVGKGAGGNTSEIALWFSVAPTVVGINVQGRQPLFELCPSELPASELPVVFISSTKSTKCNSWTLRNLHDFIDVSMGAMATASSKAFDKGLPKVTIPSWHHTTKLDPARPPLLAIPICLALSVVIALL
ncbi:hypothetical protein CDV31_011592 [Fusarium ambrosium]|uniref:Uncharacterized protein n=1 Tax=Fusarium ambrosium TaxID=131363 RepID=A0A428TFZ2_9HYPO|nr:hypothetical protein CDV31_011592 [Fusarium ambrosium]